MVATVAARCARGVSAPSSGAAAPQRGRTQPIQNILRRASELHLCAILTPVGVAFGARKLGLRLARSSQRCLRSKLRAQRPLGRPGLVARRVQGSEEAAAADVPVPRNLYELLGLSPGAVEESPELLKQRQRALLKVCHPDVAGDEGAALTMLVAEAADVLASPTGRSDYDQKIRGDAQAPARRRRRWPSLDDIEFSDDNWAEVPEEERGERHMAGDRLFVDEVACIGCNLCIELAPETFCMTSFRGSDMDNRGGGRTARVFMQWGDSEESLQYSVECCPSRCISWVPPEAVPTLEYVCQAEEYQCGGDRRSGLWGNDNFDPLKGVQVWWPLTRGMKLVMAGECCPRSTAATAAGGAAAAAGGEVEDIDVRVVAAWAEFPTELRAAARRVVVE